MGWRGEILAADKPKYQALADALVNGIAAGHWRAGERLPPQRELAAAFGVTIATTTKAIAEIARRGLVTARRGSGTFVREGAGPSEPGAGAPPQAPREAIDLRLNTVPVTPAVTAVLDGVMAELVRDVRAEALFGYHSAHGSVRHREMVARWLAGRGLETQGSRLLLSHGAQHAIAACLAATTRPGDTVLCEAWTYAGFRRLAADAGLDLVGVEIDREGMRPDDLAAKLAATGASLLLGSPAVQNPTTATMSLSRRKDILAACRERQALIIEDDVYGHLAGDTVLPLAALEPERVFYITSLSKCVAPGIRLGLIQPPQKMLAVIQDALAVRHWIAPTLFAELFARMVESGAAQQCHLEHRREMHRRLAIAVEYLGPERYAMPTLPSYHIWLDVPSPWRLDDFVTGLEERGVRISPATHFAVQERMPTANIRICLGGVAHDVLTEGLSLVGRFLGERPRPTDTLI